MQIIYPTYFDSLMKHLGYHNITVPKVLRNLFYVSSVEAY
jgi:hypothetical protein